MKNKTAILVKLQLLELFPINKLRYSKDLKEKIQIIFFTLLLIFLFMVGVGYSFGIAYGYGYLGLSNVLPAVMVTVTSMVVLIATFLKSNGVLFAYKDYDMIMSLPVKSEEVIKSKFLSMYIFDLLFACIVMIPTAIVCTIFNVTSVEFYIMFTISLFIIPLLPMVIGATIGAVITIASAKYRFKNILTILLSFGVIIAAIGLSFNMKNMNETKVAEIGTEVANTIYKIYPVAYVYNNALINRDILSFVLFTIISIAVFIIFVKLIAFRYSQINTALMTNRAKGNYKAKPIKESSPFMALYKKELRRYFSSPMYVVNTLFGVIMLIAMAIAISYIGIDKLESMFEVPGARVWIKKMIPFAEAFMIVTSCTTAVSISLEGKNRWILSSLPIKSKTIFQSKIAVNLLITIPASIISGILLILGLHANIIEAIIIFITPIVYAFFIAELGICINLKLPNFQWVNETNVIKQSPSMLITLFTGFGVVLAPIIISAVLKDANTNLIIILVNATLVLITAVIHLNNIKKKI
ncbi:hypothetical protein [Clostridium cellulovorans]|uniref:Uncharacterized protein n=1 Tax=Clostridium cellulovorans (strain ATCC 35296 / DSM 3052 / OCM 3 / 743B) TaxID=573061 RepID=D9SSW2_CLOC7|nr:hypothetical protein [Clostridium cellulovorans]ADL52624.1 hypothetical protein Clocel_2931 [Clostridium cellulovorans 743B]